MRFWMVLALALVSLPARADRFAALPPIVADAAPEIVDRLHDAVARGLLEGGRDSVPAADVREKLAARADLVGCRKGPCAAGVAEALGATRLAASTVEITGKNYSITIDLIGAAGDVEASGSAACDICTLAEAEAALQAAATELAKRPDPAPMAAPVAAPATAPDAKTTSVSGQTAGAATVAKVPVLRKEGGFKGTLSAHRHDLIALGALLAGTAAVIGGGYLVSLHGDCSERDDPNPDDADAGTCVQLRNTGAAGAALIGGGIVAYGGAAIAVWLGRRQPKSNVYVAPLPGGGLAAAAVRF